MGKDPYEELEDAAQEVRNARGSKDPGKADHKVRKALGRINQEDPVKDEGGAKRGPGKKGK